MRKENTVEAYLQIWKEVQRPVPDEMVSPGGHLSLEALYRMAGKDGIEEASEIEIDHLSFCSDCLEQWALWRQAIRDAETLDKPEEIMREDGSEILSCGFREAAASSGPGEAFTMRSSCGRFTLGLLPRMDDPDKGLVTLEAVAEGGMSVEGRRFVVRDRNGVVVLDGRIRQGRLARTCDSLRDLDLSAWTLVMDDGAA
jgi:hypothetical protein